MTNNPKKIAGLEALGIVVRERIPLVIPPNEYNERYLHTKATKSGHLIEDPALEQMEMPMLEGIGAGGTRPSLDVTLDAAR
jgi:hypothetical protein